MHADLYAASLLATTLVRTDTLVHAHHGPRHPRTEVHVTSKQCYSKINYCFVFGTQDRGNNVCFGGSVKLVEIYQTYG